MTYVDERINQELHGGVQQVQLGTEGGTEMIATEELDSFYIVFDDVIPARGAKAFQMERDQIIRIVDVEGMQVPDFLCFNRNDRVDKLSVENTQLINGALFITTGHHLFSTKSSPLMTIVDDTCGVHDLISGSCSAYTNAFRYGVRNTPNCRSNFERVLEPFGYPLEEIPYSFNIFMNTTVSPEGATRIEEPKSNPGDYIDLQANEDLIIAISNCPQERNPCNGWNPTPLRTLLFEPGAKGDVQPGGTTT